MADKKLENIVNTESEKDIRLGRIALTTLGYGFVGAMFDDAHVVAPLTAAIGLSASVYDEVKKRGMDLFWPGMGMLVGGLIGTAFDADSNKYFPHIFSYGGAALGGALGFYKSYLNRGKSGGKVSVELKLGD
ncbi:MAG: hypothetical protein AABY26_01705 [Nanoarchaeota archaeon]